MITTEAMTQVRALKLAYLAIDYLLGGETDIDSFNRDEVRAAWKFLLAQWRATRGQRRPACQPILDLSERALGKVEDIIEYGERHGTGMNVSRQRPKLVAAARVLPEMIAEIESEEDAYWREFAAGAWEEVAELWGIE
jgi:hypothetical protein